MRIIFFILLIFSFLLKAQDVHYYRNSINKAEHSKKDADAFLKKVSTDYQKTKLPIYQALSGVGNFFLAKHSYNPFNKISYFIKGKNMLDDSIKKDPNNLEMRLLRFISQKKIPRILNYHQNLEEDRYFLLHNYKYSKDMALVHEIKRHLNL